MTSTATDTGRAAVPSLLLGFAVAAGAVAVYVLTALSPATATTVAEAVGYFTATLAGAVCLGGLVLVVITARPDDRGVLDLAAFRAHLVVERVAPLWVIAALVMVVVQTAADAGVSATRLLVSGRLAAALEASETGRGWVTVVVVSAVLAVTVRLTVRWEWHVPLTIPALVGVIAVPVTGNAGQGPDHDYTTSSVIVFAVAVAVWAGVTVVNAAAPSDPAVRRRVTVTALAAGSVAVLYGLLLLGLRAGDLTSGYGVLGLFAGAVLAVGLVAGVVALRGGRSTPVPARLAAAMAVPAALSLMAIQTAPGLLATRPSIWDVLLGYELPGAPTALRLATFWRFDTFLGVLGLTLACGYLVGVIRLRRRGDRWPVGRTVSWLAGCAALVVATGSGVRSYGSAMFSVHMAEHMMLNMFVPVLLVLGAPVTLALRVLPSAAPGTPPGPREWIVRAVHSPFTAFLSSPVTAFVLFVGSLYAVYFTPLFDTLVRYHWGHEFMAVHFLITGYLFYWGIIGVDPGPRRLPFIGRLALLFAIMPFHAFFGVAMMTMTSVVGGNFYRGLALPWVANLNDDQHLGGAIAWGASEVPLIMVVVALVTQWARQDRRTSTRSDRHADAGYDDDLAAYNNMLRELERQRTRDVRRP
ncbi:MAG TPA: cytochrome c oxidase assembly protein [Mycobacterium sp.]|nr:cytochrome c oxidase assembly protein [Mycobacterium sp.]HPZ96240.1 cytochrome c oxidase assembly protein [Mycobacterium sp.]HQE16326.1 cytochrome c oxidase assembly protein [Mycobacterium sp.]